MLLHQLMVGLLVLTVAQFCLVWLFLPSESVRPPAMLRLEDDVERLKAALANGAGRVYASETVPDSRFDREASCPPLRHADVLTRRRSPRREYRLDGPLASEGVADFMERSDRRGRGRREHR